MKNKSQKKVLIIVGIIIALISLLAYILSAVLKDEEVSISPVNPEIPKEDVITNEFTLLTEEASFWGIDEIINQFFNYLTQGDNSNLYEMLDREYIKENNISISNINAVLKKSYIDVNYNIKNIYYNAESDVTYYFVDGYVLNYTVDTTDFIDNVQFLIIVDESTSCYELRPIETSNILEYAKNYNLTAKDITGKNTFITKTISLERKLTLYLSNFILLLVEFPEQSYAILTNEKQEEFGNIDNFKNQVLEIYDKLSPVIFSYASSEEDDRTVYSVKDNKQNSITIYEYGIMNYQISF